MAASHIFRQDRLLKAVYYAPRGRLRLFGLAADLGQRYLRPTDRLIGVIGAEGSGKSTLIKGLFPGLELTNDDDGINRPTSLAFDFDPNDPMAPHTFHIDMRYELAFHQKHEIASVIKSVIMSQRRVVVEHFDQIYSELGLNAHILFGIGEDICVYRPTLFGPSPTAVHKVAYENLKYRLMAHSAEDLVGKVLRSDYGLAPRELHSEVHHGFVINFHKKPDFKIPELEQKVQALIDANIEIAPGEGDHVLFDGEPFYCTGKRCHVKRSGLIENFRLLPNFKYDYEHQEYVLIGLIGGEEGKELFEVLPPALLELTEEDADADEWSCPCSF